MGKASQKTKNTTLQNFSHRLVYALFRCIEGMLHVMPLELIWYAGRILGSIGFYVSGKYRRLAKHNLTIAFGREKTDRWIHHTAKAHFQSLFSNLLCGFKLPLMTQAEVESRVTVEGAERTKRYVDEGRKILYLVHHISCWEILTQVPAVFTFGRKPASVFQSLRNPYLNDLLRQRREKLGYVLYDRQAGFTGPMKHLQEHGALGILVDQHAGDHGIWSPFFGRLASTTAIPAMMAARSKGLLLPVGVYDDGPGRWRMVLSPPLDTTAVDMNLGEMTAWVNQQAEVVVRRQPENWFWVHNRWKLPKPRFLLKNYKRGIALARDQKVESLQKFELLVRSPNWLGDACMAFPAVRAMKAGRPDCRLTVFGPEKLRDLWESQPEVDCYIGKAAKEGVFSVANKIKNSARFDAAVLLTNSTRSTLEFWLAGIPRLVGYKGSLRSRLLTQIVKEPAVKAVGPPMHHTLKYLHIAKSCGADVAGEMAKIEAAAADANPVSGSLKIGICAGAEYGQAKRWPMDRFAQVMKLVSARHPDSTWSFYGAPGEAAMGETLSGMVGTEVKHTNLVGKTRLVELIAELRSCRLLVTNDTGTMHLAAALGVPTVSIFGSTEPVLTGPLGARHTVVRHQVPCSPCFKRECPFGHYECMTLISPERVAQAVEQRLAVAL